MVRRKVLEGQTEYEQGWAARRMVLACRPRSSKLLSCHPASVSAVLSILHKLCLRNMGVRLRHPFEWIQMEWKSLWSPGMIVVVQMLSCFWLSATPWTTARQSPLFSTISHSLLKFKSIESVTPFSHLILCALFSCAQSCPALGSFPVSQLFTSGGQSIGASASASVLPIHRKFLSLKLLFQNMFMSKVHAILSSR